MDLRVMSPTSYQTALPRDGSFSIATNEAIVACLLKSLLGMCPGVKTQTTRGACSIRDDLAEAT